MYFLVFAVGELELVIFFQLIIIVFGCFYFHDPGQAGRGAVVCSTSNNSQHHRGMPFPCQLFEGPSIDHTTHDNVRWCLREGGFFFDTKTKHVNNGFW